MEPTNGTSTDQPSSATNTPALIPSQETNGGGTMTAQHPSGVPCPTCGGMPDSLTRPYVYALGRIEPRFPSAAAEKEFAQVVGRENTKGLTDRETLHSIHAKRENRYLARQLCWILTIEALETYIVTPRDPVDFELLIEAIRPAPSPMDMDVVIGVRGPIAPPEMCNGLMIPTVAFDQIYSFDRDALIKSIPKPEKIAAKAFATAAGEVLDRILQLADNAGATDEHRALNYCALRY